eukprot:TRINITY_DN32413_c0_g1_i1.p2 TRINITY_DN32413_c0_g1~~TRINITY_DN32413_c0_g1_i1.p2  ORF type:complete len:247 (-),score=28.65 TRINITY_DN32413_c0_g1_i1:145-885(-)
MYAEFRKRMKLLQLTVKFNNFQIDNLLLPLFATDPTNTDEDIRQRTEAWKVVAGVVLKYVDPDLRAVCVETELLLKHEWITTPAGVRRLSERLGFTFLRYCYVMSIDPLFSSQLPRFMHGLILYNVTAPSGDHWILLRPDALPRDTEQLVTAKATTFVNCPQGGFLFAIHSNKDWARLAGKVFNENGMPTPTVHDWAEVVAYCYQNDRQMRRARTSCDGCSKVGTDNRTSKVCARCRVVAYVSPRV